MTDFATPTESATPVVIDVDTGTDDAVALAIAVNSPELEILGVTTVAGNAGLPDTTRNTLRLLDHLGRADIPVSVGADGPLVGRLDFAHHYHGESGLTADLPETDSEPVVDGAVEFIRKQAAARPGELTLIALGPLTNVALAIRREPRLPELLKGIVVMGGAVETAGNITPFAEFNIHSDPRAANVSLGSGIPIMMVGIEVGYGVSFGRREADWRSDGPDGGDAVTRIVDGWFELHADEDRYVLCDPMTVAAAIRPDLFEFRRCSVSVVERGVEIGRTKADYGDGNIDYAVGVDVERARAFVLERLRA